MGLAQRKIESEPLYTEQEYLALEREADERSEYLDGVIYAMASESPNHGTISTNLVASIVTQVRRNGCRTFTKDTKVRSGPLPKNRANTTNTKGLFSYPDLVVVCGEMQFLDEYQDVLVNPILIIEVLSDSTESFDRVAKFQRYQKYLPSLTDYVLVSQTQPHIEHYHRHSPELWHYTSVDDLKGSLLIQSLNCRLRLADIYELVVFPPAGKKSFPKRISSRQKKRS